MGNRYKHSRHGWLHDMLQCVPIFCPWVPPPPYHLLSTNNTSVATCNCRQTGQTGSSEQLLGQSWSGHTGDNKCSDCFVKMEKTESVPVLIGYRKINLFETLFLAHQKITDEIDGNRSNHGTGIGPRRSLPMRSFSICSIISRTTKNRK